MEHLLLLCYAHLLVYLEDYVEVEDSVGDHEKATHQRQDTPQAQADYTDADVTKACPNGGKQQGSNIS